MQILLNLFGEIKKRKFFRGADACIGSLFFVCYATTHCSGSIFPKTSILVILDHTRLEVYLLQHIGINSPKQ